MPASLAVLPLQPAPGGYPSRDELFLAIDTGGSKCDCVIASGDGAVLAWGTYRQPGLSGRSARVVGRAVRQALRAIPAARRRFNLCLIYSEPFAADFPFADADVSEKFLSYFNRILGQGALKDVAMIGWVCGCTEYGSALSQHGLSQGIVALAGTGAFIHVCLPTDKIHCHLDGYGPVLGDHGGAYQIGREAFRAAAAAHWSARRATSLRQMVFEALKISSVSAAVELSLLNSDRSLLASLAKLVNTAADEGDAVARSILFKAADDLAETLFDALAAGNLFDGDAPLVGTGSIATRCTLYWQRFCERVQEFAPKLQPRIDARPAVLGILGQSMARRYGLEGADQAALAATLNQSYDVFVASLPLAR